MRVGLQLHFVKVVRPFLYTVGCYEPSMFSSPRKTQECENIVIPHFLASLPPFGDVVCQEGAQVYSTKTLGERINERWRRRA